MSCSKEILMSELQSRPILWQDTHKHFKNQSVTDKLWTEVGRACGVEGNIAKSKLKNLRDQFRREVKKIPVLKSGSQAIPTKTKWQYFESMQFLRDYTRPAQTQGNLNDARRSQVDETQRDDNEFTDDEIEDISASNDESDADDGTLHTPSVVTPPPLRRRQAQASSSRSQSQMSTSRPSSNASVRSEFEPRRISQKRKTQNINQQYLELQKKEVTLLEKEINRSEEPDSADLHFFKSLLPYMESLSLFDKLELRSKIQQLVFDKFKETMNQKQQPEQQKQQFSIHQQPLVKQKQQFVMPEQLLVQQTQQSDETFLSQYDETLTYHELLPCQPSHQSLPHNYCSMHTQKEFNAGSDRISLK